MNTYIVKFYINSNVVGSSVQVKAWSRKEAWIESWNTADIQWDATVKQK